MTPSVERPTGRRGDRFLGRSVAPAVDRFLRLEAAGGLLLAAAAVVALVWANSPWSSSYESWWSTELTVGFGGHAITEDLRHWINDGLMTLFFLAIGLEIKQELTNGQLAHPRDAVVPAVGALGGMVVPALLFLACNLGGAGAVGWGVPMATDVAFALGVLALLGDRVPSELKVLLLGLAVIDDVGAIVVIAVVYSGGIDLRALAAAAGGLVLIYVLRRRGVRYLPVYVSVGALVWLATFESGVHATIAGVALGLLAPAQASLPQPKADRAPESIPVTERLQDLLHPWTTLLIVPIFSLANAGVSISGSALGHAATSPVTIGVIVALVAGKLLGVAGAIFLVTRLRIGRLPASITVRHVIGLAGIAGMGFTVSLFVTGLAFDDPALADQAKIGVLVASLLAAMLGSVILRRRTRAARATRPA